MVLQVSGVEDIAVVILSSINTAVGQLVISFISSIPSIIIAIVLLAIGYIVAVIARMIIVTILDATMIDKWFEEQNLSVALGGKKVSTIVGLFAQWYIIAIFLAQSVSTFQLATLRDFLTKLADYIPLVLAALVIFAAGLLVARYIRNAVDSTKYKFKKTVGLVVEILIVYIALVIALQNIGVNVEILVNLFNIALTAFVLAMAIIVGISFGFAFKGEAKKFVDDLKK